LDLFLTTRGKETDNSSALCQNNIKRTHRTLRYLKKLQKKAELTEREQEEFEDLKLLYPLYGLKNSLRKLHNGEEVMEQEIATIVTFIDTFSTVSLHPAIVGSVVAAIAEKVNQHHHTKTCRKYQTVCRFKFPKLPSYVTIIARPPGKNIPAQEKKSLEAKHDAVIKKVKEVLNDDDMMKSILEEYPKVSEKTVAEATEGKLVDNEKLYLKLNNFFTGRARRIDAVLEKAGLMSEEGKQKYQAALLHSSSGYKIVMARDVDELWVNSYNPEITRAWNGNTDFQICLDFYAIITYITEYYVKDDTGVVKVLVNTLKASD
jgi:hypothetical protein